MKPVRAGDLQNSPSARVFPPSGDHRALAAYWGWEAAQCMTRIDAGSEYADLDEAHAWRCAKMAWYHALTYRGVKE